MMEAMSSGYLSHQPPAELEQMLRVEDLVKKFGDFAAVDGVYFAVRPGEIFGFLGPNGAGKTTTINMLAGLAHITSGSVEVAGFQYPAGVKKAQAVIGIVPDESNLYEDLDGFDNLSFCASLYGLRKRERESRAAELLRLFGLAEAGKKPFKAYSKGMKRKLTIAAAIIHQPAILFLDEPTTGIDVASARQIRQLLVDLNRQGTTIFLTTHYIEEAERLCHRIAFIVRGKIERIATLAELMGQVQQENIVQFTLAEDVRPMLAALRAEFAGIGVEKVENGVVRIHSPERVNLSPFMKFFERHGATVYEAKVIRPSLEDVFVQVTGVGIQQMKSDKEGRKR
jgi:ABC-2 type transport system ATP-binding protein